MRQTDALALQAGLTRIHLDDGELDLERCLVIRPQGTKTLTQTELKLLRYLLLRPGQAVSTKELLTEVWGHRPGVVTRAIHHTVHRLRHKIEVSPTDPKHLRTVFGVGLSFHPASGPEHSSPVHTTKAATPPAPVPLAPWTPVGTALPPRFHDRFVGRDKERNLLRQWSQDTTALVSLLGPGGVGKTRLAAQFASELTPPPVWIGLAAAHNHQGLYQTMATALGVQIHQNPVAELGRALRRLGPRWVLLDNVEQIATLTGQAMAQWLQDAPQCRFLVTTRIPLRLRSERVLPLSPLETQSTRAEPSAALELFMDRLNRLDPHHNTTADDPHTLRLMEQLGGLPLAIELAAARLRLFSVQELTEALDQQLSVLRDKRADTPARHASLEATLQWSWQLLTPSAQRLLMHCAAFAGAFDRRDLKAILEPGAPASWLEDELEDLIEAQLLHRTRAAGSRPTWQLLYPVRFFARHKAQDGRHWPLIQARLAHHCARWGNLNTMASMDVDKGALSFEVLRRVNDIEWVFEAHDDPELTPILARAAIAAHARQGDIASARRVLDEACRRCAGDPEALARLLCFVCGDNIARVLELDPEVLHLAMESVASQQPQVQAFLAFHAMGLARVDGRWGDALSDCERALQAAQAAQLGPLATQYRAALANILRAIDRFDEAHTAFEAALQDLKGLEDLRAIASASNNLAILHHQRGDVGRAVTLMKRSLKAIEALGDWRQQANAHSNLGYLAQRQQALQTAQEHFEEGLKWAQKASDARLEGRLLMNMAENQRQGGLTEIAMETLERSIVCFGATKAAIATAASRLHLASLFLEADRWDDAAQVGLMGCQAFRERGANTYKTLIADLEGILLTAPSDDPEARQQLARAFRKRLHEGAIVL